MKGIEHIKKTALLLVVFMLSTTITSLAQDVKVSSQVDKSQILIGDHINLEYKVDFNPQQFRVQLPQIADTFNKFETIRRNELDTLEEREKIILTQQNIITNFDSGVWVIPAQKFVITPLDGSATFEILSDSIPIVVNTVAVDTSKPIKPIFEIIAAKKSFWDTYKNWFFGFGALMLLGILLFFLIKKYRSRKKKITVTKKVYVAPWDNAIQKIQSLQSKKLWLHGEEKKHHTELTDIIRTYIEDAFGLDCFEKTSQEIVTDVKKFLQKNKFKKRGEELDKLRNIFFVADMVKFAKSKPSIEEHEQSNVEAASFVESTATFIQRLQKQEAKP